MKSLVALLFLIFSAVTYSAEIKVFEIPQDTWTRYMKGEFEINRDMGRAWVSIEVASTPYGQNRDRSVRYFRQKVDGLTYDASINRIMLEYEGQLIECGYQTGRYMFKRIVNTNCKLETRKVKKMVDDGYRTYKRDYLQLFIVTR